MRAKRKRGNEINAIEKQIIAWANRHLTYGRRKNLLMPVPFRRYLLSRAKHLTGTADIDSNGNIIVSWFIVGVKIPHRTMG